MSKCPTYKESTVAEANGHVLLQHTICKCYCHSTIHPVSSFSLSEAFRPHLKVLFGSFRLCEVIHIALLYFIFIESNCQQSAESHSTGN